MARVEANTVWNGAVRTAGALLVLALASGAAAQSTAAAMSRPGAPPAPRRAASDPAVPADYRIVPNDVLSIVVWRETEASGEAVVRPDGKISLPLLNDMVAAGFSVEQLRARITEDYRRFFENPVVTIVVKQVNNNKAFVMGQVLHPGAYVLSGDTTVLQIIATAGGFAEFADVKHVTIMRTDGGQQRTCEFNYDDFLKRKNQAQNIALKPGDTIIVP
jgi:polysaccharide export outer membrane protein